MNYTESIYKNFECLKEFEEKYEPIKLSNRECLKKLLALETMLNGNNIETIKEIASDSKDIGSIMAKDILEYALSDRKTKPLIIRVVELIDRYTKITAEYIDTKGYNITMKDLADMLDLDEDYISRNLMGCFDYFKIKTVTRQTFKIYGYPYRLDFINKNVFFSRKSVRDFLLKYLKFSFIKTQVDLTMPEEKYIELMAKFKTETTYRRALNKILDELNTESKELKDKKIEAKSNGKKFTRMDFKLHNIDETIANDIIAGDTQMQSIDTIRNNIVILEAYTNEMTDNVNKKLTSLNDPQLYKIIDNRLSSVRFVIDGLSVYNKQLKAEQKKIMVRYSVKVKDIVKFRQENDNYLYSIDESAYDKLIGDAKTKTEKQEKIINYFYKRLMDPDFVVKNKRKED